MNVHLRKEETRLSLYYGASCSVLSSEPILHFFPPHYSYQFGSQEAHCYSLAFSMPPCKLSMKYADNSSPKVGFNIILRVQHFF